MRIKALVFTILFTGGMLHPLFSQTAVLSPSAHDANRRTALRCLQLANDYATAKDWNAVIAQVGLGLSYDETLSDLWYMLAVAQGKLGATKAQVGISVQRALSENSWVNYNRDSARILFADILCDTGRYAEVFAVLDGRFSRAREYINAPYIYSADAEYIRAKAYYRLGDSTSVALAREKIDDSRQVYPEDARFPLLLFTYENPETQDAQVRRLASLFISEIKDYAAADPDKDAELEIRAARFADPDTRRIMLQSFSARGLRHPLYASLALNEGLITEQEALDYLCSFADDTIMYGDFISSLSLLQDNTVKEALSSYLNAYNGVLLFDTTGDGIENLVVKYERGRPATLFYDANQDGSYEWTITCDFGTPVAGTLHGQRLDFTWGAFPFVKTATLRSKENATLAAFSLVPERYEWAPVQIVKDEALSRIAGADFFVPAVNATLSEQGLIPQRLLEASSSIVIPSEEREGATVTFSLLRGEVQMARYRQGNRLYAQAEFQNGLPSLRLVDSDDDGVFETTEFYAASPSGENDVQDSAEEQSVKEMIFGTDFIGGSFYLRMVQVDSNADTIPDFTEEYLVRGGKISSWDTNADGKWDIRMVRLPRSPEDGSVAEQDMFYAGNGNLITVTRQNGKPVAVRGGNESLAVTEDARYRFYWIGTPGTSDEARLCLQAIGKASTQGTSLIVQSGAQRIRTVRIGETCYGQIIAEVEAAEGEQ